MLQSIAGYDPADPVSRGEPVPDYTAALRSDTRRFRIGVPRSLFAKQFDSEHAAAFSQALAVLATQAGDVRDIELPPVRVSIGFDTFAEYYGEHEPYLSKTPELYQPRTRQMLETTGRVTAAAYSRSQHEMALARRSIMQVFSRVDLLVLPMMLEPPLRIEEVGKKRQFILALAMPFNLYAFRQ
jgi:aspartyl-tRNA(Asn)/glutamyl-tRNA(Gln) amidotransferase subunit A